MSNNSTGSGTRKLDLGDEEIVQPSTDAIDVKGVERSSRSSRKRPLTVSKTGTIIIEIYLG